MQPLIFKSMGIVDQQEIEENIINWYWPKEWYGRITVYAGNLFIIEDFNMHVLRC